MTIGKRTMGREDKTDLGQLIVKCRFGKPWPRWNGHLLHAEHFEDQATKAVKREKQITEHSPRVKTVMAFEAGLQSFTPWHSIEEQKPNGV